MTMPAPFRSDLQYGPSRTAKLAVHNYEVARWAIKNGGYRALFYYYRQDHDYKLARFSASEAWRAVIKAEKAGLLNAPPLSIKDGNVFGFLAIGKYAALFDAASSLEAAVIAQAIASGGVK